MLLILQLYKRQGRLHKQKCSGLWNHHRLLINQTYPPLWVQSDNFRLCRNNSPLLTQGRVLQASELQPRAQQTSAFRQTRVKSIISTISRTSPHLTTRTTTSWTFRQIQGRPFITIHSNRIAIEVVVLVEAIRLRRRINWWLRVVKLRGLQLRGLKIEIRT